MSFLLRDVRVVEVRPGTGHGPEPVDVRVRDGEVADIGRGLDRPVGVPEYDGQGRWLIPGLWDQHTHLGQWTMTSSRLDLAPARSVADVQGAVAERLRRDPEAPIVVGWGHRSPVWPEPPTVAALDLVTGARPVVLISGDGHHAWVNSAGLRALGLPQREGMVEESEWFEAYPRLTGLLGRSLTGPDAYRRMFDAAAAQGVVGLVDLEFDERPDAWASRTAAGAIRQRVRVGTYAGTLDLFLGLGLRTGDVLPDADPRVTMGSLKIISDGSLNTRTAWCCAPYADRPDGGVGAPNLTSDELRELLTRASVGGLRVATHAIGDRAVTEVLDAYAATGARGSIEHAQLMKREDVPRLAALGLKASVQPHHLIDDREVTDVCWSDRSDRCFMFRSMLDAGVEVVLGSDAPVAPLDPWLAIAGAVHRAAGDDEPWHPQESITAREALAASVDGLGTVHEGMPADLVLLDADPLDDAGTPQEQAARLRAMSVAATWVGGEPIHGELRD
ncbi:MAG: amidohydrolase [Nocardioidaceae bacterium]|nr:amidohydrolase [Nocardioidaceae bacterium]